MGLVKYSTLVEAISGKVGTAVFAKNRGGAYVRSLVIPFNPQSAAQQEARSLVTQFSQQWPTLTQAQILAWNNAAPSFAGTNVFGETVEPSGINLFVGVNCNIIIGAGTAITAPPVSAGTQSGLTTACAMSISGASLTVTNSDSSVNAGSAFVVEATAPLSPGISNAGSLFRRITVFENPDTTSENSYVNYTQKYGTPTAGKKVFVRTYWINQATGEKSGYSEAFTIIAA